MDIEKEIKLKYRVGGTGVFWITLSREQVWLCDQLLIVTDTCDATNDNWARHLRWNDADGITHEWVMPQALLAVDGAEEVRATLMGGGLRMATDKTVIPYLIEYLHMYPAMDQEPVVRG